MLTTFFFYVFAAVLLASATAVITCRNPVHSVLCLILAFFNAAALFLIAGAEFLAMILVIVYVGAVAVLFLFVVMMLDVNFAQAREGFQRYAPVGAAVGLVLFAELALVLGGWKFAPETGVLRLSTMPEGIDNTRALGHLIYTDYILLFQSAGLILMVAMIGAIVLTHRKRTGSRRQNIATQNARTAADTLTMVKVDRNAGIAAGDILRPLPEPALTLAHGKDEPHAHGVGKPGPGEH
ncbi:MAG: NADH-quinone oxidoreductase subunit J [Janthinobacterium lividum]